MFLNAFIVPQVTFVSEQLCITIRSERTSECVCFAPRQGSNLELPRDQAPSKRKFNQTKMTMSRPCAEYEYMKRSRHLLSNGHCKSTGIAFYGSDPQTSPDLICLSNILKVSFLMKFKPTCFSCSSTSCCHMSYVGSHAHFFHQ